jgi:hypothetical protein
MNVTNSENGTRNAETKIPEVRIRAHARIEGGRFISEKNMQRIRVRSLHVQRGHDSSWRPYFDPATYKETWVIRKHPQKGYIFLEISHGGGVSGFRKTLRELILSVAFDNNKEVVLSDEPIKITADGERRIQQTLWGRMIAA